MFFAHSTERRDRSDGQPLSQHLLNVAIGAGTNAAKFDSYVLGHLIGLLHDLGKYSEEFQQRLGGDPARVPKMLARCLSRSDRVGISLALL